MYAIIENAITLLYYVTKLQTCLTKYFGLFPIIFIREYPFPLKKSQTFGVFFSCENTFSSISRSVIHLFCSLQQSEKINFVNASKLSTKLLTCRQS